MVQSEHDKMLLGYMGRSELLYLIGNYLFIFFVRNKRREEEKRAKLKRLYLYTYTKLLHI